MLAVLLHTKNMIQLLQKCTYPHLITILELENIYLTIFNLFIKSFFVELGKFEFGPNESKVYSKKRVLLEIK